MSGDAKKRVVAGASIIAVAGVTYGIAALVGANPGYALIAVGSTLLVAGLGLLLVGRLRR
ncbi:hypothetical protein AB0H18_20090 [Streptomyces sp. NPDC020766]|uniref:hypothetical protein n=1 Tax=Streptomyces sp. NPDC020766 TaxID=3155011 RepID=UPI0034046FF0